MSITIKTTGFVKLAVGLISMTVGSYSFACSVTDTTWEGANADACNLVSGNDTASNIGFEGFTLLDKTDEASDIFQGIEFTLTAGGGSSGDWLLGWTDTNGGDLLNLPLTMDFVFVSKAATSFASYLFEDKLISGDPGSAGGTWLISWTNNGGQIPSLSHGSIYGKIGDTPDIPLPEPATLGLFTIGMLSIAGLRRRKG